MSLFAAGATHPFTGEVDARGVRQWMIDELAIRAGRRPDTIDTARTFDSYGLDSRTAVEVSGALEKILGRRLSPALLFDHPCVDELVGHLVVTGYVPAGG